MSPRSRRRARWPLLALATTVVVVLLGAEALYGLAASQHPLLQVTFSTIPQGAPSFSAKVTVVTGISRIGVHVALLPGRQANSSDPTLIVFADPAFPQLYMGLSDIYSTGFRVASYLSLVHQPAVVVFADASQLGNLMNKHPRGYLLMLGTGIIPSYLFSNQSDLLPNWVRGGGTLVWAGGPLAYSEGEPTPTGFVYTSLLWEGQNRFLGFPLTDPLGFSPTPPLTPQRVPAPVEPSALQQAIGIGYNSVDYGGNLSELAAHAGVAMGFVAAPSNGSGAQTSVAWVPLGNGSVLFFGGAAFRPGGGNVPEASLLLGSDITTMVGLRYVPVQGPSAFEDLNLGALSQTEAILTVSSSADGVIGFARSETDGSLLFFEGVTLVP